MNASTPARRNDLCPCGSGKKFKVCCEGRILAAPEARRSRWLIGGVAVAGLAVAVTAALQFSEAKRSETDKASVPFAAQPSGSSGLATQPPGSTPPGKVWSSEHGHFHDQPGAAPELPIGTGGTVNAAPGAANTGTLTPEPSGPPPAGKVWAPEHGHYHDAPTTGTPLPK